MSMSLVASPWEGLLPKFETQALDFVRAHPDYDGRGIVVGILDTGVSPSAIGLKVCPDGRPKVIDIVDCSGSGDVAMGQLIQAVHDEIKGVGGRTIKLNPQWKNPSGKYRVGIKQAFELYPRELKERVKEQRKKAWMKSQIEAELDIRKAAAGAKTDPNEIKNRLDVLKGYDNEFDDIGPIYDCVVFHDGDNWNAVIDTSETGDMSALSPMKNYALERQYAWFSDIDALAYSVNIFDEGSTLSIVVDAGAHGSHVAGIVAAYHADQSACNGVAPGAQIVSLKIGDSRLGSMETGVGLCRGLIEAVKRGCHIINMSYGEAVSWDNQGRFVRLAEELVYKHGIIFVSSAGNNGPALSTVGSPGGTSACAIGVAAMVTQSLMLEAHSLLTAVPPTSYTWSSVGPTLDGHRGVSIIAPGAAVTSVPSWCLSKNQLMNGTSMSSPNATGCIALLLSAAKQRNIAVSPLRMRSAIQNSARILDGVETLGQGHGLIQVSSAWEHLLTFASDATLDVYIDVAVMHDDFDRGIYLRQPSEVSRADVFNVSLSPRFHDDTTPETKINYELRLSLRSTADWVSCPTKLLLAAIGKSIAVKVDPRALPLGVHTAFVYGYDEDSLEKGPVFEIPVVAVKPEVIAPHTRSYYSGVVSLKPAERMRRFLVPPPGCTFIDVVLRDERTSATSESESDDAGALPLEGSPADSCGADRSGRQICLHAIQLFRGTPYRDNEKENYFLLTSGSEHTSMSWAVTEGVTMELVLARYWSTAGDTECSYTLTFRGVQVLPPSITLTAGQRVSEVIRLHAAHSTVEIAPSGKLDKWIAVIKPITSGKVATLGERDRHVDGSPIYQLVLEYELDQVEAGDVTPRWPGLNGILYESEFTAQFCMIFDSKKRLVATSDAWPKSAKLSKGKYVVRLQVKHDVSSVLETLADMPMRLERSLKSSVAVSFYKTQAQAIANGSKISNRTLLEGGWMTLLAKEPSTDQLPKGVTPGDILVGSVTYLRKPAGSSGTGTRPGGYPVRYIVKDTRVGTPTSSDASSASPAKETNLESNLDSAVRDAKFKFLKGYLGDEESFSRLVERLEVEYSNNLQLYQIILSHAVKLSTKAPSLELFRRTVTSADKVVSLVDQDELARALVSNADKDDPSAVARKKDAESKKAALVEALAAKALALALSHAVVKVQQAAPGGVSTEDRKISMAEEAAESLHVAPNGAVTRSPAAEDAQVTMNQYTAAYKELARWDDVTADKHWFLAVNRHMSVAEYGTALKRVNDLIAAGADTKNKELPMRDNILETRQECLKALGWEHVLAAEKSNFRLTNKDYFDTF